MRFLGIVQARMGSTRLPGKVMMDLAGRSMLERVVRRAGRARTLEGVVVATTVLPEDSVIEGLCREMSWPCFRGARDDVLDRYYRAASEWRPEAVVRISADCPFIDPGVVDRVVGEFLDSHCDYASNTILPRTFPLGLDTEVLTWDALERAWREDTRADWREHVTPYVYRNPDRFSLHRVAYATDCSAHRWTVDTPKDLEFARSVYDCLGADDFEWRDVLAVLEAHPHFAQLNRGVVQKSVPA
jgi:spore coat polysaccharide biosynthesis protein SpsF